MTRLMLWALLGGLSWVMTTPTEAAEMRASTSAVRKEVISAIEAQLAYFRKGDIPQAYAMASAGLRAQRSQQVFAAMVEAGYPEIWINTRAEFGVVRNAGDIAAVVVQVYSKTGRAAYDYTLVREEGGWRVHGVLRHAPKNEKA